MWVGPMVPSVVMVKVTGHWLQSPPLNEWMSFTSSHTYLPLPPSPPTHTHTLAFSSWIASSFQVQVQAWSAPNSTRALPHQPLTRAQGTTVGTYFNVIHSFCGKTDAIVGEESFLLMRKPQQPTGVERAFHQRHGTHPTSTASRDSPATPHWGQRTESSTWWPTCSKAGLGGRGTDRAVSKCGPSSKTPALPGTPGWSTILPAQ